MIINRNRNFSLLAGLFLFFVFYSFATGYSQKSDSSASNLPSEGITARQDTAREFRKRNIMTAEEPDTNFTYEKYAAFLKIVSDTSKYIVLPINEFRTTFNTNKIIIGLRHDVDIDLNKAYQFSATESNLGIRSTYYILHTAPYYLAVPGNMNNHNAGILPLLNKMQDERRMEIGWHNDLVTLQAVYNIDPFTFFQGELAWLRANGIKIYGSASHGSPYCYTHKYLNYYFFEECTYPAVGQFVNNLTLQISGATVPMKKGRFSDFNLDYEAYFLNNNKYFSDASITGGIRWNIGMLDINKLQKGDRIIILLHPVHWHKASVDANIELFLIGGQKSSTIDAVNSTITIEMPENYNLTSLLPIFKLSPGSYAKVSNKIQESGITVNNLTNPLIYTVYAENRDIRRDWTIKTISARSSDSDFLSFEIPGLTKSVVINSLTKTIILDLKEGSILSHLPVQFKLSDGARAWIGNMEQFSNNGFVDFTKNIKYEVIAQDGISSSTWTITIMNRLLPVEEFISSKKRFIVYPNPSHGIINIQFNDKEVSQGRIDIYDTKGAKVYSEVINNSGSFSMTIDLTRFPAGVYFVKYSESEKPAVIVIHRP